MESNTEKKENKITEDFLNTYLKDAVAVSAGETKAYANKLIRECYERANKEGVCDDSLLKAAGEKEKALKKQASKFGLKTRMNYMTDADHYKSRKKMKIDPETTAMSSMAGVCITGTLAMASVLSHAIGGPNLGEMFKTIDPLTVHLGIVAAGTVVPPVGYLAAKGAGRVLSAVSPVSDALLKSKTAEEKKSAEEYAKIKHAQLALKVLKNAILHPTDEIVRSNDDASSSMSGLAAALNRTASVMSASASATSAMVCARNAMMNNVR